MTNTTINTNERHLQLFMMASFVSYLSWGLTCMLAPQLALDIAGFTGSFLVSPVDMQADSLQPTFWEPLADGAMATLILCSFMVARAPRKHRLLVLPMLASKAAGSLFAVILILRGDGGPSVAAMLLTDIPLLVLTYLFWLRARPTIS
jgi:hypothetical protein